MNHRESFRLTVVIGLTALFLNACGAPTMIPPTATPLLAPSTSTPTSVPPTATTTSAPPPAIAAFPIGWFDCPDCGSNLQGFAQNYADDGTLIVYDRGAVEVRGQWYVEGDIYHTGDDYCHDYDEMPALYQWHFDGEFLSMELIEDDCFDRIDSVDGKAWRLVETFPIPKGSFSAKDGDYTLEIGDDHTFAFSKNNGTYDASGTFSANDFEVTWKTDSYCDQRNSGKATYAWHFENDVLSFQVIGSDKCVARKAFLLFAFHNEQ